jgi:DNA-binding XRE family transcriptional regulator
MLIKEFEKLEAGDIVFYNKYPSLRYVVTGVTESIAERVVVICRTDDFNVETCEAYSVYEKALKCKTPSLYKIYPMKITTKKITIKQIDALWLYAEIGKRVKSKREQKDLLQADLAIQIGVERTSIVNLEAGKQRSPIHVLYNIALVLGCAITELLPEE